MNPKIIALLMHKNNLEKKQLQTHQFINDMPPSAWDNQQKIPLLKEDYFLGKQAVYISKHNRFAPYPLHGQKFLEINYMFSGSCQQIVDEKKIELKAGDILLMNVGAQHSIAALGENDILINILFTNQNITFKLLHDIHKNNSLSYKFLADISLGNPLSQNYILFTKDNNSDIKTTMDQMIEEYFLKRHYSNSVVESYLNILLIKIIRHYPMPTKNLINSKQKIIFNILEDITQNYQTITLTYLSHKYGYNKNYLSNLIKKMTGKNFSSLKTQQRIIKANELLNSTTLPINTIMDTVGLTNKSFFYKKYKEYYHKLPGERNLINI
ncbi:helix-turn-helix domain-containing protein [Lactobacillus mellis]|uniref:AraC family transcriptional regulator n=1 Tax=Bombilactobacillus mellis TaxID=1218508 RepID=UPI00157FE13B|nr:helix-turn-helix domain-containing protein [Bombilactobacillus mellis]NUG67143.1 helix-turn-helix domain-containing protein [Bombilactobacillus mellis]